MGYKLFLDDVRRPEDAYKYMYLDIFNEKDWIIVRNYYAFISLIEKKGVPEIISFDHDLADEHYKKQQFNYDDDSAEKTGYHCANWLLNYCLDNGKDVPEEVIIHSMNPYGSLNILSLFKTFYKTFDIDRPEVKLLAARPR